MLIIFRQLLLHLLFDLRNTSFCTVYELVTTFGYFRFVCVHEMVEILFCVY